MQYKANAVRGESSANPSCLRFCTNVCSQFVVGRQQCILDCLSCRGVQAREAQHGGIFVTSTSDDDGDSHRDWVRSDLPDNDEDGEEE